MGRNKVERQCPRCHGKGASKNPADHGWARRDPDAEPEERGLRSVKGKRAACSLCGGKGYLTALELRVIACKT
jgi:hypothetical protein